MKIKAQKEYLSRDGLEMVELLPFDLDEFQERAKAERPWLHKDAGPSFPYRPDISRFLGGRASYSAAILWEYFLINEYGNYVAVNREFVAEVCGLVGKDFTSGLQALQRRGYAFGEDLVRIDKQKFNRGYSDWLFYRDPDGESRRFKDWEMQGQEEQLTKDAPQ